MRTEWVAPYNDLAFGLHKAAKYIIISGWHGAGKTLLEFIVNKKQHLMLYQRTYKKIVE